MIGIVVIAHGRLAEEFCNTAREIIGDIGNCEPVSILSDEGRSILCDKISNAINKVDKGEGVLILVDTCGGSPATLCLNIAQNKNIKIISGLNLSMLLEAIHYQNKLSLQDLAARVEEAGKKAILDVTETFRQRIKK